MIEPTTRRSERLLTAMVIPADAVGSGTPGNTRAAMVLARLGVEHRETLARLRGGVVITGRDLAGADIPVPEEVVTAVGRCGLKTPCPAG